MKYFKQIKPITSELNITILIMSRKFIFETINLMNEERKGIKLKVHGHFVPTPHSVSLLTST